MKNNRAARLVCVFASQMGSSMNMRARKACRVNRERGRELWSSATSLPPPPATPQCTEDELRPLGSHTISL